MRTTVSCFVAAALLSGPALAQSAADAELFAARCGKCHTVDKLAPDLAKRAPAARERYLERFLQRHYAPDAAERKRIVAWLSAQVGDKR
jgi:mono/diheme cytochrome c family protein